MKYNTIIIGGGPAGMLAAITAADKGLKVCLVEHQDRVGKKILSTGNGKCNLTNLDISPDCYHSNSNADYFSVVSKFSPKDIIKCFEAMGMLTVNKNGYIYPRSEQASYVLDVLRTEMDGLGIKVITSVTKCDIQYNGQYIIKYNDQQLISDKLILACGSKCASKTGSDGSGYNYAKGFGHSVIKVIPALVQLICKESFYKELQGVRADAALCVTAGHEKIVCEAGELQLTGYGISGIPVFQISRTVKRLIDDKKNPMIHIDFAREYTDRALYDLLLHSVNRHNAAEISHIISGVVNKKLANVIIKECNIKPSLRCGNITSEVIKRIVNKIKNFVVIPKDTNGFENAQVCAGGVNLDEVNLDTMESRLQKNLYFAGEILDVDGKCGGYNLTWAFASGRLAGENQ